MNELIRSIDGTYNKRIAIQFIGNLMSIGLLQGSQCQRSFNTVVNIISLLFITTFKYATFLSITDLRLHLKC